MRNVFGGMATTDENGRFQLDSLVVGRPYDISLVLEKLEDGVPHRFRTIGAVTAPSADSFDLGELRAEPEYEPPPLAQRINDAFDVQRRGGSAADRFGAARRDAALARQHVLVLFGNPRSDLVGQFMKLRFEDFGLRKALAPYRFLAVNSTGSHLDAARELAATFGEQLPDADAEFLLCVVNTDAAALATLGGSMLLADGALALAQLRPLLEANAPQPLNAQELLQEALAQAKAQNKRVLLQETATWCGPCHKMSTFLDAHRQLWEKDYLWVKVDHRWEHALEVMERLGGPNRQGIPWWAILDAEGQVLITSIAEDGDNIGFPNSSNGAAHFRWRGPPSG